MKMAVAQTAKMKRDTNAHQFLQSVFLFVVTAEKFQQNYVMTGLLIINL